MKLKVFTFFLLIGAFLFTGYLSTLHAKPTFWTSEEGTPTPPEAPETNTTKLPPAYLTASPTPNVVPSIQALAPTPTPRPGVGKVDPTAAAVLSAVVPGSGQVYAGDPLKGIVLAGLFGVGLYETLDQLSLHQTDGGTLAVKNEDLGSLAGLATLVVYGYQIQDASDTANAANKKNYLTFNMGLSPEPNVRVAYRF